MAEVAYFESVQRNGRKCTATVFDDGAGNITHVITSNFGPSDMRMTLTDPVKSHLCRVPIGKSVLDKIPAGYSVSDTRFKVMN